MGARPFIEDIFRSQGEWIRIFTGQEVVQDPYEQNVTVTYNNSLPILAIVTDLTAASASWKMPGVTVSKMKEIHVKSKYRPLLEMSQKIEIEGDMYEGWRENGKLQIRQMAGNVLRVYVYIKRI